MTTILELTEYIPQAFPAIDLPQAIGEVLWQAYAPQVHVEPPSFKNNRQWTLTPQGWVGYIPVTTEFGLHLRPRVPLDNLFGMLEIAYHLRSFRFLEGAMPCASLAEFYERLAHVLAQRVLDRARRGLYRGYVAREERLSYITGRLDVQQIARKPWTTTIYCEHEEHTADVSDNQILAWTLRHILHSGQCTERTLPTIRQAYRTLRGTVTSTPITAKDCVGRLYRRLNADYQPLHALCRFILEHSGPSHRLGERNILPFLVNMPRLYELFIAEWLRQHLPSNIQLKSQDRVTVGADQHLLFEIDLTLYDAMTGNALCVLDTKYKIPDHPTSDDVAQVVAYAEARHCQNAVLIYPQTLPHPLDTRIGDIRVRSLTFGTAGDLDAAGQRFLNILS